jgi:hypothetical protein
MQSRCGAWRDVSFFDPDLRNRLLLLLACEQVRPVVGPIVHARRCGSTMLDSLLAKLGSPDCCCAAKDKPDFGSR